MQLILSYPCFGSDPSPLLLTVTCMVHQVRHWYSSYFGLSWVPFLGWVDVCVLRSPGKLSHTTRGNGSICVEDNFPTFRSQIDYSVFFFILFIYFFLSYVRLLVNAHRRHWVLWIWSYSWLWAAQCEWWELNFNPLQSWQALLRWAISPASKLSFHFLYIKYSFFSLPCEFNFFPLEVTFK